MTIETRTEPKTVEVERTREGEGWEETYTDHETREIEIKHLVCDIELLGCEHDIGLVDNRPEHAVLAANPLTNDPHPGTPEFGDAFRDRLEQIAGQTLTFSESHPEARLVGPDNCQYSVCRKGAYAVTDLEFKYGTDGLPCSDEDGHNQFTVYHSGEIDRAINEVLEYDVVSDDPPVTADYQLHVCTSCADELGIGTMDDPSEIESLADSDGAGDNTDDTSKKTLLSDLTHSAFYAAVSLICILTAIWIPASAITTSTLIFVALWSAFKGAYKIEVLGP